MRMAWFVWVAGWKRSGGDAGVDDFDLNKRLVVAVGLGTLDGLHHVHALVDTPKHRVLVIEPGAGDSRDEELGAVCVWARIGHADREGAVVPQRTVEFVFEVVAPDRCAACPITEGVASLEHEALDDAVQDEAVVVPVANVLREVLHGLRALFREELDVYVAEGGVQKGVGLELGGPARRQYHLLLPRRLLVEHVPPHAVFVLLVLGLAAGEEIDAVLLESRARQRRVARQRLLAGTHRVPRQRLGLILVEGDGEEALGVFHLAQDAHQPVRLHVHHLDAEHGGIADEMARLVEHNVGGRRAVGRTQLLFNGHAAAKVDRLELVLLIRRVVSLLELVVEVKALVELADELAGREREHPHLPVLRPCDEALAVRAHGQRQRPYLVLGEFVEICFGLELERHVSGVSKVDGIPVLDDALLVTRDNRVVHFVEFNDVDRGVVDGDGRQRLRFAVGVIYSYGG
mmetsp:Transcript_23682/g.40764  ORF Transcript_23682/g.40764 Transcript_23682/m.40764 type:complete len:459 (-) Transcript_23682:586-1962(-)